MEHVLLEIEEVHVFGRTVHLVTKDGLCEHRALLILRERRVVRRGCGQGVLGRCGRVAVCHQGRGQSTWDLGRIVVRIVALQAGSAKDRVELRSILRTRPARGALFDHVQGNIDVLLHLLFRVLFPYFAVRDGPKERVERHVQCEHKHPSDIHRRFPDLLVGKIDNVNGGIVTYRS